MVSRVRPIDVSVSFDDRTYKLGEAIDLTIEMSPNRECQVREGRAGLMLEERWTERSTLSYEKPIFGQGSVRGGAPRQIGTETVTKDVSKDHKETSVHSSVVLLENVQVQPGSPARHAVRLQVQREAPPHAGKAKIKWWLQTVIDVAGARDIKPRHKVTILAIDAKRPR